MRPNSMLWWGLALALFGSLGCPTATDPFGRDDDDDSGDDDDSVDEIAPDVLIIQRDGAQGVINITLSVSHEQSLPVDVELEWRDSTVAVETEDLWQPLTTCSAAELAGLASQPGENGVEHIVRWVSDTDFEGDSENIQLRARGTVGTATGLWAYDPGSMPADGFLVHNRTRSGVGNLPAAGALESIFFDEGEALVPLNDGTLGDNRGHEFAIILANPGTSPADFNIVVHNQPLDPPTTCDDEPAAVAGRSRDALEEDLPTAGQPQNPRERGTFRGESGECTREFTEADPDQSRTFFLRDALRDATSHESQSAFLVAVGEGINIWWDERDPILFDADCDDPSNELEPLGVGSAFGLTNCDINEAAAIYDLNILPNLETLWGPASDVDTNCAVDVVVSRSLNRLTADDIEFRDRLVPAYTQPLYDLADYDAELNPASNEGEVLYVHGPDPAGFANSNRPVPVEGYASLELAGQLAASTSDLLTFAALNQVASELLDPANPGSTQDGWINKGLRLLAADLTGFGAVFHRDVWDYLDAPWLSAIQSEEDELFDGGGAQYLFARYLYDRFGADFIAAAISAPGPDGIYALSGQSYGALLRDFAVALTVSGLTDDEGLPLVPDSVVPNFRSSVSIVVPDPSTPPPVPTPGLLWGANGYQLGFNLRGVNRRFSGGTDAGGATELIEGRVRTAGPDWQTYHPSSEFFGSIEGGGGLTYVRVVGLSQPDVVLSISSSGDLVGAVVRMEDLEDWQDNPPVTVEQVLSARTTDAIPLPILPESGEQIGVVGRITAVEGIDVCTDGGGEEVVLDDEGGEGDDDDDSAAPEFEGDLPIPDTDLYTFEVPGPDNWRVAIWLDRRYTEGGLVSAIDPWLAIAEADDVPDIFALSGICSSSCENYPAFTLQHQYNQNSLISNPSEPTFTIEDYILPDGDYDCFDDYDQDGIQNGAEVSGLTNFADQIRFRQFDRQREDPAAYDRWGDSGYFPYTVDYIDVDSNEFPDDSLASRNYRFNTGGRAGDGEEAYWEGVLLPGVYTVVVGSEGTAVGPYELSLQRLE